MTELITNEAIASGAIERLAKFQLDGKTILCKPFGCGNINNTYLVLDETARAYILQKINKNVFRNPLGVMRNIVAITDYLSQSAKSHRSVLELIPTVNGDMWLVDDEDDYWRVYSFITDSVCFQRAENEEIFKESARAFGAFQRSLSDFPAEELHETIPWFHNTPKRYEALHAAVKADSAGRAGEVGREIEFLLEREGYAGTLMKRNAEGSLPLRVTHNDTKLNNVLFDRRTRKFLCVVDLDTVMPGFSVTDFGDSIRYGASTAAEDEKDLSKVHFSLQLFKAYAEGFLGECGESLTDGEAASLSDASRIITLENGVRFLTDYLSGDVYFRTLYETHNIDRCRTQLKLVEDMEKSFGQMQSVVENLYKRRA